MHIHHHWTGIGPAHRGASVAMGNFDGVHLGHQSVIALAAEAQAPLGIVTFEPHPREFFAPAAPPFRLMNAEARTHRLEKLGVAELYELPFDARLAGMEAETFVAEVLVAGLGVAHVTVGADFCFGKGRKGNFAMLQAAGDKIGFGVESMHTFRHEDERVSSSAVRAALAEGDMPHAARLLGRSYSISGRVMHGDKIGRTIGFPTANIQLKHRSPPLMGIYTVSVDGLADRPWPGVASVGVRPTINDAGRPTLEVHLFDWDTDCYDAHLRVNFLKKQRDEERYDSLDALTAQIARDAEEARAYFVQNPL